MKKFLALILGIALIFSVFRLSGAVAASAEGTDYCIKVLGAPAPTSRYNGGRLNVGVTANATYTVKFSYYYKTASGTPGFRVLNGGNSGDDKLVDYTIPSADNDAGWKTYTVDVAPTTSTISVWFHNGDMSADGKFYVDDVSVVKSDETANIFPNGDFSEPLSSSWKISATLFGYSQKPVVETEDDTEDITTDYALQVVASQQYAQLYKVLNVDTDTDYIVKLDVKSFVKTNTQLRVYTGSGTGGTRLVSEMLSGEDWTTVTYEFNSGSNTQVTLAFVTTALDETAHTLIDNVSIYKNAAETAVIYEEDFASGSLTDYTAASGLIGTVFNVYTKEENDTEEGEKVDYALQVVASQQYAQLYKSMDVDTDTDYIVKLDVKSFGATNAQLRVYTGSGTGGTRLVAQMFTDTDWATVTYEFNSGSNTQVTLAFVTTVLNASAYTLIDNVSIYKKSDETAVVFSDDFSSGDLKAFAANSLIGTVFNVYNKDEYDYNADGTVNICDLVLVAEHVSDPNSNTKISLAADNDGTIEEADIATTRTVLLERY